MPLEDLQNEITESTGDAPSSLEEVKHQVRCLPDEVWRGFLSWVLMNERRRRDAAPEVAAGQAEVVRGMREQGVVDTPDEPGDPADVDTYPAWRDPGTIHGDMYLLGDRVCHNGKIWESGVDMLNSWEPGSAHTVWRDITDTLGQEDEIEEPIESPQPEPVPETEPEQPAEEDEQATPDDPRVAVWSQPHRR